MFGIFIIRKLGSEIFSRIPRKLAVKNLNFDQKSNFRTNIKLSAKNQTFGQKSKFWSKFEILVKIWNFCQNLKFWSKFEILTESLIFGWKFCAKIDFFINNQNFVQKMKFWSKKSKFGEKNWNFCQKSLKKSNFNTAKIRNIRQTISTS